MKKVVIFGGGSGLSQLLKGMTKFPMDVTAVVSVADNGKSTGRLREEFAIPAVGDITKVLMAMSTESKGVKDLFNYRFSNNSSIGNHSIKNLIMTALLEMKGDFAHALPILCDLLDVKGKLLPLTEDKQKIKQLKYNKDITVYPKVLEELKKADLIVFSSGSLLTSIMPHIIVPEIQEAIKNSKAKKMYICNMITQPGETDNFKVSDHLKVLEQYLGKDVINVVVANNAKLPKNMSLFAKSEGKEPVDIDEKKIEKMGIHLIEEKLFTVEEGYIRHDSLKTAFLMFAYLMENEQQK